MFNFKAVLQQLIQRNASDLHLKVGRPPTLRLHGDLVPLDHPALRPEDLKGLAEQLMTPEYSDSISFMIFIASMMQRICPFETRSPTATYALAPGSGDL